MSASASQFCGRRFDGLHAGRQDGGGDLDLARGYWRQAYDLYRYPALPAAQRVRARLAT